jgi:hypothetical protein
VSHAQEAIVTVAGLAISTVAYLAGSAALTVVGLVIAGVAVGVTLNRP